MSSKQKVVARLSIEVESRALALTSAETTWIEFVLLELNISLPHILVLYYDNMSATMLAANPIMHAHMKHVKID